MIPFFKTPCPTYCCPLRSNKKRFAKDGMKKNAVKVPKPQTNSKHHNSKSVPIQNGERGKMSSLTFNTHQRAWQLATKDMANDVLSLPEPPAVFHHLQPQVFLFAIPWTLDCSNQVVTFVMIKLNINDCFWFP